MTPSSTSLRVGLFYVAVFAGPGVGLPFLPAFLEARGLDARAIGLVLAVQQVARLAAGPVGGRLADGIAARPRAIALYAALSALGVAVYLPSAGLPGLLLAAALYGAFAAPIIPLADAMALREATAGRMDFGRVRSVGSVSFILFTGIAALLLPLFGPSCIVVMMAAGQAVTALAALLLPAGDVPAARGKFLVGGAMLQAPFLLVLLIGALVQGSHALLYAFSTLHWTAAGHSPVAIGMLWTVGTVAEIILLTRARALAAWLGPVRLAAVAACAGVLRWAGTAATTDLLWLVPLQVLHATTFACMMLASLALVARLVPPELQGTAQTVHASFGPGLGMFLLTLASGPLYAAYGGTGFLVMAASSALALPAIALLSRRLA
jgi:PPP family 3-phenylpropionic acid transporter